MSRYRFVEAEKGRYPVTRLCRMAQVSRGELPDRAAEECIWALARREGALDRRVDGEPVESPEHAWVQHVRRRRGARIGHDQAA